MTGEQAAQAPFAAGTVIDELFAALSRGDIAAARACCTEDARIWHSFDRIAHDRDQAAQGWAQFVAAFPERKFVDARRSSTERGFVQQHLMVGQTPDGSRLAWPVCVVVEVRGGRISRLEEYIDRAGSFMVIDDHPQTPGLSPS
jgi:ketosteroid isomerase-like protein